MFSELNITPMTSIKCKGEFRWEEGLIQLL